MESVFHYVYLKCTIFFGKRTERKMGVKEFLYNFSLYYFSF